jgi:hypothetical protein
MKPEQVGLSIGIGILLASIFFVGVQRALGFTPWLLYVIPLGLTYLDLSSLCSRRRGYLVHIAHVCRL